MRQDYSSLPDDLPRPHDDGASDHLKGMRLPPVRLPATTGASIDLATLPPGRSAIFVYPMTGRPGAALPEGWDAIPGARGCTPQNCAIRDVHREFVELGVSVYALSTQSPDEQAEMAARLHLPYPVLSDETCEFAEALRLPMFEAAGVRRIRRLTLIVRDGVIEHVFYPVFPPDRSAEAALEWLRRN